MPAKVSADASVAEAAAPSVMNETIVPEEGQPAVVPADTASFDKHSFRPLVRMLQKTLHHSGFDVPRSGKLMLKLVARAIEDLKQEPALMKEAPSLDRVKEQLLNALAESATVSNVYEVQQYQVSSAYEASLHLSAFV